MKKLFTIFLLFISFTSLSQLKTPPASPAAEIEQLVGLTEIEVEYNRPSMKGREIFGNLVPYGKLWRTGANSGTKISFSTDVVIDGKTIKEGTYPKKRDIIQPAPGTVTPGSRHPVSSILKFPFYNPLNRDTKPFFFWDSGIISCFTKICASGLYGCSNGLQAS